MKSLEEIRAAFALGNIELTAHALKRVIERDISRAEIIDAGRNADEIEDYPHDKYYPSCLLLGFTAAQRPLHMHVSRVPEVSVRLITIYEPNPDEWVNNYSERKI